MAPRDKKGILFISRAVVQSCLSALCVHSRLANVLLRFNLDNKFQRGGGTESYVREQTLENQSRQLPESALSSRSSHSSTQFMYLIQSANDPQDPYPTRCILGIKMDQGPLLSVGSPFLPTVLTASPTLITFFFPLICHV